MDEPSGMAAQSEKEAKKDINHLTDVRVLGLECIC